ncbi:unnamed protein product, partial [Hapterophycus canaliculatus]
GDNQPEFVFVGKAMAHMTDRGCELAPIAKNLAHLPQTLNLEVFEQIAPEEVRRFSGEKTVAEAGLSHGSVLLFRSAQQDSASWPPHGAKQGQIPQQQAVAAPVAEVSACVPFNAAAAAAAAAAMAAHAAVTGTPKPLVPSATSGVAAAAAVSASTSAATAAATSAAATSAAPTASGASAEKSAPGWDGGHMSAAAAATAAGVVGAGGTSKVERTVVMDAEAQKRATCLALYQIQETARQHQVKEAARAVAKKLAAEAALAAAKEQIKRTGAVLDGGAGLSAAAAKTVEGEGEKAVAAAEAAAAAAAAAMKAPATPVLTPAEKAEVAAAAKMAAHAAAMEHAQSRVPHTYRTISITEALREGAPPTLAVPMPPASAMSTASPVAQTAARQVTAQAGTAVPVGAAAKVEVTTPVVSVAPAPSVKDPGSVMVAAPVSTTSSSSPFSSTAAGAAANVDNVEHGGDTESGIELEVDVDGRGDALSNAEVPTDTLTDTPASGADSSKKKGGSQEGSAPKRTTPSGNVQDNRGIAAPAAPAPAATAADGINDVEAIDTIGNPTPPPISATRASKAAAAAVGSSEDDDGLEHGVVAAVVPVEMHRRSSRKAAAVAAQQIQTTARAGTRGGGGGGGTDAAAYRSPRGGSDDAGGGGQKRRAEEGELSGTGTVSKKSSRIDEGGGSAMSAVPAASPVPSDLSAFIAQLMHVPGFTMEKCMELTRSKERAEVRTCLFPGQ